MYLALVLCDEQNKGVEDYHCWGRKGILLLKETVNPAWNLALGMVLPPASTVVSAYMAA